MRLVRLIFLYLLASVNASGQFTDIAAIHHSEDEIVSHLLFENTGEELLKLDTPLKARAKDLPSTHPQLTVSGDFTGDGLDEIALFYDLTYSPNNNPDFTSSIVRISRSTGDRFHPLGTWFSELDTILELQWVDFTVAYDYNLDGLSDIGLLYNDPMSEQLYIYVLESTGSGFTEPKTYFTTDREEFNFTAIEFACPGDFNGNGIPDLAVFYNYFGESPETEQSIFIFETNGNSFTLLPAVYEGVKADYNFSDIAFSLSGDYNQDGYSDIAVLMKDTASQDLIITVFEGSEFNQLIPHHYSTVSASVVDLSSVTHTVEGNFIGNDASDLALFHDHPVTGNQEIHVLESQAAEFKTPVVQYDADPATLTFNAFTTIQSGRFFHQPLVSAATWKDDKQGAISFTFDDGYLGAFEHGASELEAAGLKGTFYVFTDTTIVYDGMIAPTNLVRSYKDLGHEIGSHSSNHSDLGSLTEIGDFDSLIAVLSGSLDVLNERYDQATISMSIPYGSFRHETLEYIARYFYTGRSSQYGFNPVTPYDDFALKSWPVLNTTSPAFVDSLVTIAESYGYYLPLMYHEILDEPFDEDHWIYAYSKELLRETIQNTVDRSVWIDTHESIYKYIQERNALKIEWVDTLDAELDPGYFSFIATDGLNDSVFDVELTLKIRLPESWTADTVTVSAGDSLTTIEIQSLEEASVLLYNCRPDEDRIIHVYEGNIPSTGIWDRNKPPLRTTLSASPNPFTHETLLTFSGDRNNSRSLIIRDLHGRTVKEIHGVYESYRLLRGDLSPGIYILQLIDIGTQVASLKIIAY